METYALFNPKEFSCNNLQILGSTLEELFYKDNLEYKRVEEIKKDNFGIKPYKCYLNDQEITESDYEFALTDDVHTMERSHLVFLEGSKVCDFYFYHMYDYTIIPVVEIEFFSLAEREAFIRPYWFGKEVDRNKFEGKAIYEQLKQIV